MPLAGVLSAVRELLLDDLDLPDGIGAEVVAARTNLYRSKFTTLTAEEVEDLAKIPPERLRVYTQTVFAGERNNLKNHFPMTFALLQRALGEDFDSFQMMRDLHAARPWKSYRTADLCLNFCQYLVEDRLDIKAQLPELPSVSELERLSLKISRGPNPEAVSGALIDIAKIAELSVADLMEFSCVKAPCSQFLTVQHDVLSLREYFYEHDRELPDSPTMVSELYLAGARSRWGGVRWCSVNFAIYESLAAFERGERFTVSTLAEVFLKEKRADEQSESDDSQLFLEFFKEFQTLVQSGVLLTDS